MGGRHPAGRRAAGTVSPGSCRRCRPTLSLEQEDVVPLQPFPNLRAAFFMGCPPPPEKQLPQAVPPFPHPLGLCAAFQKSTSPGVVHSPQDRQAPLCPPGTAGARRAVPSASMEEQVGLGQINAHRPIVPGEASATSCPHGSSIWLDWETGLCPPVPRTSEVPLVCRGDSLALGTAALLRMRGAAGQRAAGPPPTPGCLHRGTLRRPAAQSAPAW